MSAVTGVFVVVALVVLATVVWWALSRRAVPVVIAEPVEAASEAEAKLAEVRAEGEAFRGEVEAALEIEDERERLQRLADLGNRGGRT